MRSERELPPKRLGVVPVMEGINDVHVSEPGLVVVDIAAAGDKTMFTFHTALAARWATTSTEPEDLP
ncbi:hypothetical protein EV562_113242 [Streptomyces sp. BK208]|uniref:DUF6207 family protein n=1 Tax=Streptomyces sp. BK208 TaxID=2512150 RepID=UPI001061C1D4|nr:DUF6207 family protein [Streptomyces sp. BK208]TDT29377.1 hypothetical protein EV562_113242 [Streptomyces sp. BK208]